MDVLKKIWFLPIFLAAVSGPVHGQKNPVTTELSINRVNRIQTQASEETILIHTDRRIYIAGETTWFCCNLINEDQRRRSPSSKVVYLELLNPLNMPVIQQKVLLHNGTGQGCFEIPDSASTGNYILRAYTSWMKNFGPEDFFYGSLQVFNPYKKQPAWIRNNQEPSQPVHLNFFPEGGRFYRGLEHNVVVSAQNHLGEGIIVEGIIYNNNESIDTFKTDSLGLGAFHLTSLESANYRCLVHHEGKEWVFDIPSSEGEGIALHLDNADPDVLKLLVNALSPYLSENQNQFQLVIRSAGEIEYQQNYRFENQPQQVRISRALLAHGINQIMVLDQKGVIRAERLIYNRPVDNEYIAIGGPEHFRTREKVNLEIQFDTNAIKPSEWDHISISVAVPTRGSFAGSIDQDFLDPFEAFKLLRDIRTQSDAAIDRRLMTLRSYRYRWTKDVPAEIVQMLFPREENGMYVTGSLVQRGSGLPVPNELLYLSLPGQETCFSYAYTDQQGAFRFMLPEKSGTQDLIIQPARLHSEEIRINIDNPYSLDYVTRSAQVSAVGKELMSQIIQWSVNFQLQHIYNEITPVDQATATMSDSESFYGDVDKVVSLGDFINLPVMEEVFHELVYGVRLRKEQSDYQFVILDKTSNTAMSGTPTIFLDGVYVHEPGQIADIKPEQIDRIEVIRESYQIGDIILDGIISMYSKNGDFHLFELPITAVRRTYPLFSPQGSFNSPDHSDTNVNSRIPDMRNTLFWAPNISLGEKGQVSITFFTSDFKSDYEILVRGLTHTGQLVHTRKIITVQ